MADGQDKYNTANSDDIKNLLAQLKQSFDLAETPIPENEPEQTTEAPIMNEEEFEKLEEALVREGMLYNAPFTSQQDEAEEAPNDEPTAQTDEELMVEDGEAPEEDPEIEIAQEPEMESETKTAEESEAELASAVEEEFEAESEPKFEVEVTEETDQKLEAETETESEKMPAAETLEPLPGQTSIFEMQAESEREEDADIEAALDILDSTHRKADDVTLSLAVEETAEEPTASTPDSPALEIDWESFLQCNLPQAEEPQAETLKEEEVQADDAPATEDSESEEIAPVEPVDAPELEPQPECEEPAPSTDEKEAKIEQTESEAPCEEADAEASNAPPEERFADADAPEADAAEERSPTENDTVPSAVPVPEERSTKEEEIEKSPKAGKEPKPKEHWYVPDFMRIKERTDRYCDKHLISLTVRFWLSLLLALCLLVFENYDIFGTDLVIFANQRTAILVNLLLLAVSAGLAFPELKNGVLALVNRRTTSESFLAVGVIAVVLYDAILLLMSIGGEISPRLIALVPAASISLYLNSHRRYARVRAASIHSISDGRPMLGLIPQFANLVPEEKKVLGKLVYEDSLIARTREVRRVDGVTARLRAVCEDARPNNVLLIVTLSLSLIAGLVMGIVDRSVEGGLLSFCFALFLMIPGALLYTRLTPISRACRRALDDDGVILGESSVFLYSELGAVSFLRSSSLTVILWIGCFAVPPASFRSSAAP